LQPAERACATTARASLKKRLKKARDRKVFEDDFPQLAGTAGGTPRIKDDPPLIYHVDPLAVESDTVREAFLRYRESLPEARRRLLDQFELIDLAVKVVGVGSVGTICGIALLMAGPDDPLFLQVKQARTSELAPFAGPSQFANEGQRVVIGHQLMQSASEQFLGWTTSRSARQYYIRPLRDMKLKPLDDEYSPGVMRQYAEICGWTPARAHAGCSEPAKIAGYMGKSDRFDKAIAEFGVAYADQNERDFKVLQRAARNGEIDVAEPT
jgi:uncharacterized protein (DUF2252 family)